MTTQNLNGLMLYFVAAEGPKLCSEQDALDLLGATYGTETDVIVVPVERFAPEFFDLSSRLAGHFFQKLENYQMRLAILGDLLRRMAESKALTDFVGETNRRGHHYFAADRAALEAGLGRMQ